MRGNNHRSRIGITRGAKVSGWDLQLSPKKRFWGLESWEGWEMFKGGQGDKGTRGQGDRGTRRVVGGELHCSAANSSLLCRTFQGLEAAWWDALCQKGRLMAGIRKLCQVAFSPLGAWQCVGCSGKQLPRPLPSNLGQSTRLWRPGVWDSWIL